MTLKHYRRHHLAIGSANLLLPLLVACASPGPPRPPSLNLAALVTDLTAERVGNDVYLHWTTPSSTTDGIDVKGQFTAELCREADPSRPHPTCAPITRLSAKPGNPSQVTDRLPEALTTGPASLIAYRVQILNESNRAAGLSRPTFAAAGAAPPPVDNLRGTASRNGATLEWLPQPTSTAWIELDRILLPTFSQTTKPSAPPTPRNPLNLAPDLPTEVHLQTPKDSPDTGGTLDRTAKKTETYTYQAQRIRPVTLEGHALELRSALSPIITIHIADTFPPQPPTGLAAVPGEPTGSHTAPGAALVSLVSIDLSWEPVPDTDLAGYLVYRRSAAQTNFQKLTSKPVIGPAYTDSTATAGQHYIYRVTAIDTTGNESQPSNEAEETATPNP